ncbi:unnamed protein product [Symbiodinium natans]|uniref:Reverse transcriptase domain-containing protein n=1 Tax=Symbiodinium natans TaxID=878477 RepID=A0A812T1W1_9DINO|nr:unnamed protein product [Symbiodinium natans]
MSLGYSGDSPPASPSPSRREAAANAKKHKGGVERLMLSVRAKIGDALDIDGLPKEAAQLLAEAEALLRKGEQELAKPRLERIVAGIDAEDMFHGADEHARRYLMHTFTDLDPDAAAGHQVEQTMTACRRKVQPGETVSSPKASAKQALHAENVAKLLEKALQLPGRSSLKLNNAMTFNAGHFDFDALAFAALPEVGAERRPPEPYSPRDPAIAAWDPPEPLVLNRAALLANLRRARKGAAPGPSGMTAEILRVVLASQVACARVPDDIALSHAVQARCATDPHLTVVSIDASAAHDGISREAVLRELRDVPKAAALLPFVRRWLDRTSTYVWQQGARTRHLRQAEGVEQGDPLSPALFSLGLRAALRDLQLDVRPDLGERVLAYLDDVTILASPQRALDLIRRFGTTSRFALASC